MYVFLRFSNFQHHSSLHYQEQNCHIVYETLRFIHKLCQIFGYGNFMCQCINFMFWHMEYYKTNLCCLRYMMLAGGCVFFGCCSITSTYPFIVGPSIPATRVSNGCGEVQVWYNFWAEQILILCSFIKVSIWILDIVLPRFHNAPEKDGLIAGPDSTPTVIFHSILTEFPDFISIISSNILKLYCITKVEMACYHVQFGFAKAYFSPACELHAWRVFCWKICLTCLTWRHHLCPIQILSTKLDFETDVCHPNLCNCCLIGDMVQGASKQLCIHTVSFEKINLQSLEDA